MFATKALNSPDLSMRDQKMETFCPASRQEWREWLQQHHRARNAVWLIYYKSLAGMPTVSYSDAVDEALCFGWIDSKVRSLDDKRFMQFFSKRKPNSVWSKVNKEKVERLIASGVMTEAGSASIEIAKQNGSWTLLDTAEALEIPNDLEAAFSTDASAKEYFFGLSRSDKRNMLQWLVMAKRTETRQKRVAEIVALAGQGQKPKQFR
jgi:uncharacterized protein YdeI (YjbR/CyaY-like superfamily)